MGESAPHEHLDFLIHWTVNMIVYAFVYAPLEDRIITDVPMPENCFSNDDTVNGKIEQLTIFWAWFIGRGHLSGHLNSGPIIPDGTTQEEVMRHLSEPISMYVLFDLLRICMIC